MSITVRPYQGPEDFYRVGDFLIRHYQPGNRDGNWFQPTWEYMHSHPMLDESSLGEIGIWEEAGRIVAVAHYESTLGEAFFDLAPGYAHLKRAMLEHAQGHLCGKTEGGRTYLKAFVNDFDVELADLVRSRGYERDADNDRPMSQFDIPSPFPAITLTAGFKLQSLQDDNNLYQMHRVLWRGFNHPGEPSEDGIAGRVKMQSVPNFNKDLKIVAVAPDGNFVSLCGMWYDAVNRIAYVEPVATDPDYRRMGLGKAAVWEGIRRCGALGATVAFVGSEQKFYLAIGFHKIYTSQCWNKYLDPA